MLGRRSVGAPPADEPGLPQVLHDAPAAVLVIDLDRQQVVYANAAATALTGEHLQLPVDVDTWSDAAGLTDLGGRRMSELASESMLQRLRGASTERSEGVRCASTSPLSLVAAGVPVAGEPVAVHDAARRGSSLSPAERQVGEGRLLWVTGFTLSSYAVFDGPGPAPRAGGLPAALGHRAGRPAQPGAAARPGRDRHRDVVHNDRPAPARPPSGVGQPVVHPPRGLPAGGGRRPQLPAAPCSPPACPSRCATTWRCSPCG